MYARVASGRAVVFSPSSSGLRGARSSLEIIRAHGIAPPWSLTPSLEVIVPALAVTKPDAQRRRTANPSSPVDASTARRCGSAVPTPGIVVRGWLADALARVAKIVGSTGVATTISMLARAWDEGADYSER